MKEVQKMEGSDIKDSVVGVFRQDVPTETKADIQRAINELLKTIHEKPNVSKELHSYRKYVPLLIKYCEFLDKFSNVTAKTIQRIESGCEDRKYERWSDEEDALLIELVCSDRSIVEVSAAMGRTIPSIKTRVSKLVGIKRITQDVAGRFIGYIDGKSSECIINGTVTKQI